MSENGINVLLADWRAAGGGGDVADLIEAARAGQEGVGDLCEAYGVTLKELLDAAPSEGAQRATLRPGASLQEIVAREAADLAEHRRWLADYTRRRLAVDRGLRARPARPAAPGGQDLAEQRAPWADAFAIWTQAGGRPGAFLELSEAERAALEYSGPLPAREELAEFEAREAWLAGGGDPADFELIEPDQRRALIAAFGG